MCKIMTTYTTFKKNEMKTLSLKDLNLEGTWVVSKESSKIEGIMKWMQEWIEEKLANGSIQPNSLLPPKTDFAYFLGVSVGTVQNVFRRLEDLGYLQSKQRLGTFIADRQNSNLSVRKHTSKRELAIWNIKKFIISNKIKHGEILPSTRILATLLDTSVNTVRLALLAMCTQGILEEIQTKWVVKNLDFEKNMDTKAVHAQTIVQKLEHELEEYIDKTFAVGEVIPSHLELAKMFNVSIKTVHDAMATLIKKEILLSRRGRYGTVVMNLPKSLSANRKPEESIFAPAKVTAFYHYEKTQNMLKKFIAENYSVGDKIPSVNELSKQMDISPNTLRKALHNLASAGYLTFSRGRYGGTFVLDIPNIGTETFKWLSVNPQYAKVYGNN